MKKLLALLLVVFLFITTFTACSKETDSVSSAPTENNSSVAPVKLDKLPEFESETGEVTTFKQDNRRITKATMTTVEDYNAYLQKLLDDGFTKYAENQIGDCLFTTLTGKLTTVTLEFLKADGVTLVIAEPKGDLYPREQDNNYESKNIKSLVTGLCTSPFDENKVAKEGMCFIIRLDDGSFIIIDGGIGGESDYEANNILNTLKAQSPEGTEKFTIAAWIFTHCHGDHIGGFDTFSALYRDKVDIEAFYYNFPTDEGIRYSASYMFDDTKFRYNQFKVCMNDYYSDVPKIRPHTGDKMYIRNAVLETMFSYENHFPKSLEEGHFGQELNDSSIIFKIIIEGQTIMFTGDADNGGMNFAAKNFGLNLKSDIFQLPHHGMNGSIAFFRNVNPTYAFLPYSTSPDHYSRFINSLTADVKSFDANNWLYKKSTEFRQLIDLAHGNITIPLPYNPQDSEIYQKIPDLDNHKYMDYSSLY